MRFGYPITCILYASIVWKHKQPHLFSFFQIFTWLMTLTILAQCVLTGYKLYRWYLIQNINTENPAPKKKLSQPKKKHLKTMTSVNLPNGGNNSAYMDDSSSDSSDSLDIDTSNKINVFIDDDESGSLIRVV